MKKLFLTCFLATMFVGFGYAQKANTIGPEATEKITKEVNRTSQNVVEAETVETTKLETSAVVKRTSWYVVKRNVSNKPIAEPKKMGEVVKKVPNSAK